MDKVYVVLVINGMVEDVSDFAIEERDAAINTFMYHYQTQVGKGAYTDARIDEILKGGYLGFDNGHSSIQMKTVIS